MITHKIRFAIAYLLLMVMTSSAEGTLQPKQVLPVEYPETARRSRIKGKLFVRVKLTREGNVANVIFRSGFGLLFFPAVEKSVKQWQFSACPGGDQTCSIDIEFDFSLVRSCESNECKIELVSQRPLRFRIRATELPAIVD